LFQIQKGKLSHAKGEFSLANGDINRLGKRNPNQEIGCHDDAHNVYPE
jgi:hypothetical protein